MNLILFADAYTMTTPLDRHFTPSNIYAVCTSYQQLYLHIKLKPVANLLQCITSFNNRRRIHNTDVAFAQHRALTLSGQIHKHARAFNTLAPTPAPPVSPPPDVINAGAVATDITRLLYEQHITSSMHVCSLAVKDKRIFTQKRWLCDSAMDLCLHSFNKQQGFNGDVVYITSQLLQQQLDLAPDSVISGRLVADGQMLVKCINLNGNHWMCAVWSRQSPSNIYTLDSMATGADYQRALIHFITLCESLCGAALITIESLPVAQQTDGTSCGLFVIEYCKVLCAEAADISSDATRLRLQHVDTCLTRTWLGKLARTLDLPMRDTLFKRSSAMKRRRAEWDAERASAAPCVE